MSDDFIKRLNYLEKDALKETGNIGAGNAATALAQFLNCKIDMSVPSVDILPISEVPEVTGGLEQKVIAILLKVMGEAPGNIVFVFNEYSIERLLGIVLNSKINMEDAGEFEISAIKEIGNILSGSYLTAINQMSNLNLVQSIPAFAYDMAGAILSTIMIPLSEFSDYAILIETKFSVGKNEIEGYFFLIPDPGSLEIILSALGFDTE